jgi:glycosyltransferase involved in cell wall biosynthesis
VRIAQLIECDGPGGAERMVAHLSSSLQANGASTLVCVPAAGEGWLGRELTHTGIAIEPIPLLGVPLRRSVARLLQCLRAHGIEIAHSHEFTMSVLGAVAARRLGIPHVITMHGSRYYAGHWRRRLAMRAAVALSSRVVAVSHRLADDLSRDLRLKRSRVHTVANGSPRLPSGVPTLRTDLRLAPGDRLLLAVGNLYPVKGHSFLIEALGRLLDRHPTTHLAVAGRGELEPALRGRATQLGLTDRVHWLGLRADIPDLLASADVYVLPSLSEGLPLSLLEAMTAGLPIVATDVGEVAHALANGDAGVLVPPRDGAALASAIARLLDDPALADRMGARAAARAAAEYDVSHMVAGYTAMYGELLARKNRRPTTRHFVSRITP